MGYRITEKMLYNHLEIIEEQCRKLNLIGKTQVLSLTIGSKYYGNSFKIQIWDTALRMNSNIFGEYLGMTKKEADLTLCGIKEALRAVIQMNN